MRYKLRTLLIVLALGPPVLMGLRWLWIEPETISLTAFLALVVVLAALPVMVIVSMVRPRPITRKRRSILRLDWTEPWPPR